MACSLASALIISNAAAQPVGNGFTYQGELRNAGIVANGTYDLRFRLYDALASGAQVGPSLCVDNVPIADGKFTVELDFGTVFAGSTRYLEIDVRQDTGLGCGSGTGFVTLAPRQRIATTPYAAYALTAASATTATSAASATTALSAGNSTNLNGQPASFYTNATNLTAGTLPDTRLSSNVTTLSGTQTFSGVKTFSATPLFNAGGAPFAVSSSARVANLNADLLDNLDSSAFSMVGHLHDASAIASGTLSDARISANIARRNESNTFSGAQVFQGVVGVAAASPLADLHVANVSGNADLLIKRNDAAQGFNLGVNTAPILFISRSDGSSFTDILAINGTTDRVGIGTSAPDARLDVRGPAGDDPLRVRVDGSTKFRLYANGGASIGSNPASVPADGLYVHGSVGIGTTSPSALVHAVSDQSGPVMFADSSALTGTSAAGVLGRSASTSGTGIRGEATATSGVTYGVYGQTSSFQGRAVYGRATSSSGGTTGIYGVSDSVSGKGVAGYANSTSGATTGTWGESASTGGTGVFGYASATSGTTYGVRGQSTSPEGRGVEGVNTSETGDAIGVRGYTDGATGRGVYGIAFRSTGTNFGVYGASNSAAGFDFYAAGAGLNYGSASSRRWKSDITPIGDPLEKISRLRGVYYTWDEAHGGKRDVGFIAEEMGEVLPEIVQYEQNGVDAIGMDYSMVSPLLVEAIKALQAENQRLREDHASLEARLEAIEGLLRDLGLPE
ncbi:MAG: tail fiber domain-containing protein [Phycisphaeraceae bacterium]|nr:MAG: tail fiber domain-containing protein [Phycisphaeraceae bacterium]